MPLALALGLPGATEFVVIAIVGVLLLGIVITTLAISRARRRDAERHPPDHRAADTTHKP